MDNTRPARRLRIFLRDFRMLEATASLAEGQSLATYFAHRKSYVNLRAAQWTGTGDDVKHAVLRIDQVLWAAALDNDIPLTNASAVGTPRPVEMQLDGGLLLRGRLILGEQQRLSDYLEIAGEFVPILEASLLRSGRPPQKVNVHLGGVMVNQTAIQAVWEVDAQTGGGEER
ncbi:MAG TPA: hypothetical protein VFZ69_01310 [Longimicrobiales bacterium]